MNSEKEKLYSLLSENQKELLNKIEFNDLLELEEKLSEYIQLNCLTGDGVTDEGNLCISIIELIGEI